MAPLPTPVSPPSRQRCPRPAVFLFASLGCAAALLAGCTQDDGAAGADAGASGSDRAAATESSTTAVPTGPGSQAETAASGSSGGEADGNGDAERTDGADQSDQSDQAVPDQDAHGCADGAGGTEEGVDNPLTGETPVLVHFADAPDVTDVDFYYTAMDGEVDPCVPLTWVTLAGTNGTDGPGATAGSSRETVALFADGELLTEPAPILARGIDSVERLDERTVRVHYSFYDGPVATGRTIPGASTFHYDGSDVTVTDNTLPVELNDTAETLQFDHQR